MEESSDPENYQQSAGRYNVPSVDDAGAANVGEGWGGVDWRCRTRITPYFRTRHIAGPRRHRMFLNVPIALPKASIPRTAGYPDRNGEKCHQTSGQAIYGSPPTARQDDPRLGEEDGKQKA